MESNLGVAINQHYIPQCHLKRFLKKNSKELYVHDLAENTIGLKHPDDIASENHFYTTLIGEELNYSFDKKLQDLESKAAPIIKKINKIKNIQRGGINLNLTNEEKNIIADFIATMRVRTPCFLENMKQYLKIKNKALVSNSTIQNIPIGLLNQLKGIPLEKIIENEILNDEFIRIYRDWLQDKIRTMNWTFFVGNDTYPFFTSDNPVCSHLPSNLLEEGNIDIFGEFTNTALRLSFSISSKVCWVGHFTSTAPNICEVDEGWWKSLNEQRVKWANKYIYASTNNPQTLELGRKYLGVKIFDVSID